MVCCKMVLPLYEWIDKAITFLKLSREFRSTIKIQDPVPDVVKTKYQYDNDVLVLSFYDVICCTNQINNRVVC